MASKKKFTVPPANGPAALLGTYSNLSTSYGQEEDDAAKIGGKSSYVTHMPSILDEPVERPAHQFELRVSEQESASQSAKSQELCEDATIRFPVWMPRQLNEGIEDKIYALRKRGIRLKKAHVVRDYLAIFAYGVDAECPSGHRFLLPEDPGTKNVICPICGQQTSI